jgi:hypothetical protein
MSFHSRGVKLGNSRLLAGSPDQARMAAAAKSAKATLDRIAPMPCSGSSAP